MDSVPKENSVSTPWVHDPSSLRSFDNNKGYYFLVTASGPNMGIEERSFSDGSTSFAEQGIIKAPRWVREYFPNNDGSLGAPPYQKLISMESGLRFIRHMLLDRKMPAA